MPAAVWSITIVPGATPGAPDTFNPPNLTARAGDVVSWNNTTKNIAPDLATRRNEPADPRADRRQPLAAASAGPAKPGLDHSWRRRTDHQVRLPAALHAGPRQ